MANDSVSFAKDIRPLFREIDIDHMEPMEVLLDDYAFMSDAEHAQTVYEWLDGTKEPQMPPGGPYWTEEQLAKYKAWMDGGRKP